MAQRGISFNQLNAKELSKLTTVHSRVEVTNFLNQLFKKLRTEGKDKNITASTDMFMKEESKEKDQKVNEAEDMKRMVNNPDDKEAEKLASTNADKLKGVPLSDFFQGAKLTEFKQGSAMEQQILKQVMDQMDIKTEKAQSEVSIRLNPEYLGEVKLNMKVDKDKGTVSVRFNTTSREARKALEGKSCSPGRFLRCSRVKA